MLFVSEGCTELSGYCPEDLLGGRPRWGDLIHPEDREAVWQSVQEALQSETQFEVQYRLATRDKGYKCVLGAGQRDEFDRARHAHRRIYHRYHAAAREGT